VLAWRARSGGWGRRPAVDEREGSGVGVSSEASRLPGLATAGATVLSTTDARNEWFELLRGHVDKSPIQTIERPYVGSVSRANYKGWEVIDWKYEPSWLSVLSVSV
jgi:hypothetical protein